MQKAPTETTGNLPANTMRLAQKAAAAFAKEDWPVARAAYKEMLATDETNALVWANLGAVEQQAGRPREAIECFSKSVRYNPLIAQSWSALGLLHSQFDEHYLALSMFARAIQADPNDARPRNYLAITAKNLGWRDAAEVELLKAIELNPKYGIAHFNLALLYLERTPPARELARRHYERSLALGVEKDSLIERRLKE